MACDAAASTRHRRRRGRTPRQFAASCPSLWPAVRRSPFAQGLLHTQSKIGHPYRRHDWALTDTSRGRLRNPTERRRRLFAHRPCSRCSGPVPVPGGHRLCAISPRLDLPSVPLHGFGGGSSAATASLTTCLVRSSAAMRSQQMSRDASWG